MIDELDRVSDTEIKTLARIVKSIADFPNASYLLAYDSRRVAEALGNGDVKRGQPYLEKIVQLQIPMPILFRDEIAKFLHQNLERYAPPSILPPGWKDNKRLADLLDVVNQAGIDAPRTLKRVVGHFTILARMVGQEVGWVDLVGYSVLLSVAPRSVAFMRSLPDQFALDSQDYFLFRDKSGNYADWVGKIKAKLPELEGNPALWELFTLLFPALSDRSFGEDDRPTPDAVAYRRILLTVLRLGLLPDAFSEDDISRFVAMSESERAIEIRSVVDQGRWDQFSERLVRWLLGRLP